MSEFDISTINGGYFFTEPVYIDDGFVLLSPEMAFSAEIAALLREWDYKKVFSTGTPQEFYGGKQAENKNQLLKNDAQKITEAQHFFDELEKFTLKTFTGIAYNTGTITFESVAERIKELYDYLKDNRKYILQIKERETSGDGDDFFAAHSVRSTIVSIIIGTYLKLPVHQIIELGVAALIHEIGMLKLPPEVYRTKEALTAREKQLLRMHPDLGFELLKSFNFPMSVAMPALEHHERENGSGYPRRLTKETGIYTKIIAVACSYVAITENRPYRDARGAHEGIVDLLRNESKQYDDTVVRALVFSLSIYPIGQFVELSNGRKGQVIDTNPADPRHPTVQIFGEQTLDGQNKIIETSAQGVSITKPIAKDEV
jgi:HD-GYP domain-containing protein (c-di-GMP phosphodiesterase class II)